MKETKPNGRIAEYIRESEKEIEQKEEEFSIEIPQQPEFFKTPVRFGNIPVDTLPKGCDEKLQYRGIYPKIQLPFQVVERISFGHKELEPNRLIFGDNLHIMRMLPSNSIDLIYIDPPFFSGRNYNVIFGDQNEVRSFTDIWEGGMPGYLTWLNARLLEMKRLLKPTGSICVHLDWHASHYVKVEMDKIFGYENFRNEIIWRRANNKRATKKVSIIHDTILWYSKKDDYVYNELYHEYRKEYLDEKYVYEEKGRKYRLQSMYGKGSGPALRFGNKLIAPPSGLHWRWTQDKIDKAMGEGIIVFSKDGGGMPQFKDFLDTKKVFLYRPYGMIFLMLTRRQKKG